MLRYVRERLDQSFSRPSKCPEHGREISLCKRLIREGRRNLRFTTASQARKHNLLLLACDGFQLFLNLIKDTQPSSEQLIAGDGNYKMPFRCSLQRGVIRLSLRLG